MRLDDVDRSLGGNPEAWTAAVGPQVRGDGLTRDRAWVLLSWVEDAASQIVAERRGDLVERAAFAMSLLEASPLDRRDVRWWWRWWYGEHRRWQTWTSCRWFGPGAAEPGRWAPAVSSGSRGSPASSPRPTRRWVRAGPWCSGAAPRHRRRAAGAAVPPPGLSSTRLASVREVRVTDSLVLDTGKGAVRAVLDPPVIGQDVNRPDITAVVVAARHLDAVRQGVHRSPRGSAQPGP